MTPQQRLLEAAKQAIAAVESEIGECPRIGGCLLKLGMKDCCCQTGDCDYQEPQGETQECEFCEIDGLGNHAERCPVSLERRLREAEKYKERLKVFAGLVWKTRWVSEDDEYQQVVGMAASIQSGNTGGIDAAIAAQGKDKE